MSILFEPEGELGIRRSRVEMACDIMLTISRGTTRPTRMTQKANLSWGTLLMYLDVLIRNGFVTRDVDEKISSYRLTDKGNDVVQSYVKLVDDLKMLDLERLNGGNFAKSLKSSVMARRQEILRKKVVAGLVSQGYKMVDNRIVGTSGIMHEFPIVAKDPAGVRHGYALVENVGEETIISLFAKQLDTDLKTHVVYTGHVTPQAQVCAKQYGIDLAFGS